MLLHGLGTTLQIRSLVTEPLAAAHQVITLDLPGLGESAPVEDGFELEAVTGRLARALAARQVSAPFDLVGPGMPLRIRVGLAALAALPRTARCLGDALLPVLHRHPGILHRVISAHAAPTERERLAEPGERHAAGSSFPGATAYGVGGMIEDYLTYSRGWGFSPEEVEPEVQVWHGGLDPLVPIEHALQLAVSLPACRIFVDPDEGHHFFRRRLEEIMTVLFNPDRGPHSLSAADARVLLAARVAA